MDVFLFAITFKKHERAKTIAAIVRRAITVLNNWVLIQNEAKKFNATSKFEELLFYRMQ